MGLQRKCSEATLSRLSRKLKHIFKKRFLLDRALTRRAFAKEKGEQNQPCDNQDVLRVLGDAILKAILTDRLSERLVERRDSTRRRATDDDIKVNQVITETRQEYEKRTALRDVADGLRVYKCINTNISEEEVMEQPAVLGETLEAIIGAIFVEAGYDITKEVVLRWPKFKKLQPV